MTALGLALDTSAESLVLSLREVSARIGANPLLVQANTGNTSVKTGNTLWIKASGTSLADAAAEDIFVPLELSAAEAGRHSSHASIETAMHALLPWRAVLHVHSVNAVAWSVLAGSRESLARRLAGLDWAWIPYAESGMPLARAVRAAWAGAPATDVFMLGNHGIVVCGDSCEGAERLLHEVEDRLAQAPRECRAPGLRLLRGSAHLSEWRLPKNPAAHSLAMDRGCRRVLQRGVLYPCQAIYFGTPMPMVSTAVPLCDALVRYAGRPMIVVENAGVLVSRRITANEEEMLEGLAEVVRRLSPEAGIRYLAAEEIARLESGNYRR